MTPLADAAERDLIRTALDRSMVVEAAAGTGKTSELVRRIIAMLESGRATVETLVAVTFTEKAAGELKLRLRAGLEDARQRVAADDPRYHHLEQALAHLEEARVSTIHGFCADLLRERPVEAAIDPQFQVMTDPEAQQLYDAVFGLWLQEQLEAPSEGVRRALRRKPRWGDEASPTARLCRAGWELITWRDFPAGWRRDPFARQPSIDALVEQLHNVAELTRAPSEPDDGLYRSTWPVRRLSEHTRAMELARQRDYDGLEDDLIRLRYRQSRDFRKGGRKKAYRSDVPRDQVVRAHEQLMTALEAFESAADADLAALLRASLWETVERYEQAKRRAGKVDFIDLLLQARNLVRDADAVRIQLQRRFTHIFVDEFQDTDPLQAEILLLLAADDPAVRDWRAVTPAPGKLFIVGDPKQSIYRFRRADVGTYREVKEILSARGAQCVQLTTSFRAVPSIQRTVNAAFAPAMDGDGTALQASYVALSPWREESAEQPAVVALPVPAPYSGPYGVTGAAIARSLPDAVGAFVRWLLHESGWTVTERDAPGVRVAIAARHVCLLFRRQLSWGEDTTRGYVRALEARGIPHLLVGGKSFHTREEVGTMRAALSAIEWPDDELSVFATLRGSLFGIGDEPLFVYRQRFRRLHPFRIPDEALPGELQPIADALRILQALHRSRNHRPASDIISQLLDATRAHATFVLRPSGEQALANVLHLAEMARAYEAAGAISFRGFVEQLCADAEDGQAPDAPILEEGSDGVRIMNVHKAKGLEFPVVILADIGAKLARESPERHLDATGRLCALQLNGLAPVELLEHAGTEHARDVAEGVRIAYVAATRARDLLVVPAVGDKQFDAGWVSPLNRAIYPPAGTHRAAVPAPACPEFGDDSAVSRHDARTFADNVKPGAHRFAVGTDAEYSVVWWDPAILDLSVQPAYGLRRKELISAPTDRANIDTDLKAYTDWRADRAAAVERGAQPGMVVRTAKESAATESDDGTHVELVQLERDGARPAGPRYGSLVHAVLATVPLDAARQQIEALATLQGRILGATPEEVASAAAVVERALVHPLLQRARAAARRGECRRETPLTLRAQDGSLIDGVVDLAFREDGQWIVVDFKTDRELDKELVAYRRQVAVYAAAISAATGQTASGVLMAV